MKLFFEIEMYIIRHRPCQFRCLSSYTNRSFYCVRLIAFRH